LFHSGSGIERGQFLLSDPKDLREYLNCYKQYILTNTNENVLLYNNIIYQ